MPKTILIVDDDADTRAVYETALAARGYRVVTASQGAEGVHLARRHRPNLILMDLRMPVMDGWDAIRYLKSDPHTDGIPVWALSGYLVEEKAAERQNPTTFDNLIAKPIGPREIVALVEARVGAPSGHPSPPDSPAPLPRSS